MRSTGRKLRVRAQTIYDWPTRFRQDLIGCLHCAGGKYRRTRENTLRKTFRDEQKETRRITARPARVERHGTYGHWEGDTIVGRGRSGHIRGFVERKSGYLIAIKMERADAGAFRRSARALAAAGSHYRKTLTLDNGTEMAEYEGMERDTGLSIYFAHPYHSWERGSNENANGTGGSTFPNGWTSPKYLRPTLTKPSGSSGTRPRKRLGYWTPEEVFARKW
jgi:IS30 family transposase